MITQLSPLLAQKHPILEESGADWLLEAAVQTEQRGVAADAYEILYLHQGDAEIPLRSLDLIAHDYLEDGDPEGAWAVTQSRLNTTLLLLSQCGQAMERAGFPGHGLAWQGHLVSQYPRCDASASAQLYVAAMLLSNQSLDQRPSDQLPTLPHADHLYAMFLAHYPNAERAAGALLQRARRAEQAGEIELALELAENAANRFPDSKDIQAIQLLRTVMLFRMGQLQQALSLVGQTICREQEQEWAPLARLLEGKLLQAAGRLDEAHAAYRGIDDRFSEAKFAADLIGRSVLASPTTINHAPGEAVTVPIRYRGLSSPLALHVYRVDPLELLRRGPLDRGIRLNGIRADWSSKQEINQTPHQSHEIEVQIPIAAIGTDPGAYLLTMVSGDTQAITLLLRGDLHLELNQLHDAGPASLRVTRAGKPVVGAKIVSRDIQSTQDLTTDFRGEALWQQASGRSHAIVAHNGAYAAIEAFFRTPDTVQGSVTRQTASMRHKLHSIILPRITFEEASIDGVVKYLKSRSRELDPAGEGINIVLQIQPPGERRVGRYDPSMLTVSLELENIPMLEAIRYVCEAADLRFKVDPYAVIIAGKHVPFDEMEVRFYPLSAHVIPGNAMDWLRGFGWEPVDGESIQYNQTTQKLVAKGTTDTLLMLEAILSQILPPPNAPKDAYSVYQVDLLENVDGFADRQLQNTRQSFGKKGRKTIKAILAR